MVGTVDQGFYDERMAGSSVPNQDPLLWGAVIRDDRELEAREGIGRAGGGGRRHFWQHQVYVFLIIAPMNPK